MTFEQEVWILERSGGARSFADKLNHLFATVRPSAGGEYVNEQVAAAISERGVKISQSYIWQLRKSKKDNPTVKHLKALADFFGVPPAYFFDDEVTDRIDQQLDHLIAEQSRLNELASGSEVRLMAMRAGELSAPRFQQVKELLDVVYELEQAEKRGSSNG